MYRGGCSWIRLWVFMFLCLFFLSYFFGWMFLLVCFLKEIWVWSDVGWTKVFSVQNWLLCFCRYMIIKCYSSCHPFLESWEPFHFWNICFLLGGECLGGGGNFRPNFAKEMELPGKWNHPPVTGTGVKVIDGKVEAMVMARSMWIWPIGIFLIKN